MTIEHIPSESRGRTDLGWLRSRHSFSFGQYADPARMQYGALRVLNDDVVAPGAGFPRHPHANMEIVSIPTRGTLRHADSMGHEEDLPAGDVQVMTAGRGIEHAEYNASDSEDVAFFQIWIRPRAMHLKPRYDQTSFPPDAMANRLRTIVSPDGRDGSLVMEQDALISRGQFSEPTHLHLSPVFDGNGLYIFVVEGSVRAAPHVAGSRDALALARPDKPVELVIAPDTDVLVLDVPTP